jgi:hypothetical protein
VEKFLNLFPASGHYLVGNVFTNTGAVQRFVTPTTMNRNPDKRVSRKDRERLIAFGAQARRTPKNLFELAPFSFLFRKGFEL